MPHPDRPPARRLADSPWMWAIRWLFFASGCSEFTVVDQTLDGDSPAVESLPPVDTGEEVVAESCDGVDNDSDGMVDEGYPDADGDAIADCVDVSCVVQPDAAGADPAACRCDEYVATAGDTWDTVHSPGWLPQLQRSCSQTVVGDLDGDGHPEIVCAGPFAVEVMDGASGSTSWTVGGHSSSDGVGGFPPVAIADVDGDGTPELVLDDQNAYDGGQVSAYRGDGTPLWVSAIATGSDYWRDSWLAVADLLGSCSPDVINETGVIDARTGSSEFTWDPAYDSAVVWRVSNPAVGDVDGNGQQDVFFDWRRYEDGDLVWEAERPASVVSVSALLIQADADDDGEIAWVSEEGLRIVDTDGTQLIFAPAPAGETYSGQGCAGDLDGDGRPEIVNQGDLYVWAWTLDGTVLWQRDELDSTHGSAGCSVFDFDGDGRQEVVIVSMTETAILDGTTGESRWSDESYDSMTAGEVPVVVDLDGDGVAEIVIPSVGSSSGIGEDIYRSTDGSWPPGTTLWSSPNWSGTEIRPDGSIPRYPARPWLEYNLFHGQPVNPVFGADMKVMITDACTDSCAGGTARVAVQVSNLGPEGAPDDTPVSVYAIAADGTRTLVQAWTIGRVLWPGQSVAGVEVSLPGPDAVDGVVAVVGQSGEGTACAVPDCDTSNNEAIWTPNCGGP